jgi:hypothetical protein
MMPETWIAYDLKDARELLCKEWNKVFRRIKNSYWRSQFRRLWARHATEGEFYELANELHLTCYGKELPREQWSKAWQYRTILQPDFNEAVREFANAVIGFY